MVKLASIIPLFILSTTICYSSVDIMGGRFLKELKEKNSHINVIQYSVTKTNRRVGLCTGTMIGQRTMITAAHCVADMSMPVLRIRNNTLNAPHLMVGASMVISKVKMHPNYFAMSWLSQLNQEHFQRMHHTQNVDIAIVEFNRDLSNLATFFKDLKPISIGLSEDFIRPYLGQENNDHFLLFRSLRSHYKVKEDPTPPNLYALGYGQKGFFEEDKDRDNRIKRCDFSLKQLYQDKPGTFSFSRSITDSKEWDGSILEDSIRPSEENCSVAPGDSGGPLFIEEEGELKLVGVLASLLFRRDHKMILENNISIIEKDTLCWLDHHSAEVNLKTGCHQWIKNVAKKQKQYAGIPLEKFAHSFSPLLEAEFLFAQEQQKRRKHFFPTNYLLEFHHRDIGQTLRLQTDQNGNIKGQKGELLGLGIEIGNCHEFIKDRLLTREHSYMKSMLAGFEVPDSIADKIPQLARKRVTELLPHSLYSLSCQVKDKSNQQNTENVYLQFSFPLGFQSRLAVVEVFYNRLRSYQRYQMDVRRRALPASL